MRGGSGSGSGLLRFVSSLSWGAQSLWGGQASSLPVQRRQETTFNRSRGSGKWPQNKPVRGDPRPPGPWPPGVPGPPGPRPPGSRVSSELRQLIVDDLPEERDQLLAQRADRDPEGLEVVFGVAPCLLALTQGRRKAQRLFVKEGGSHRPSVVRLCEEALSRRVPVQHVPKKTLDLMSCGAVHQGVCLRASPLRYLTQDPDPGRTPGPAPLWLVLEKIQDPMNLGAVLRSAYFLGVERVVSSLRHSCPLTPAVSKASSGAAEVLEVFGQQDLEELLRRKEVQGWAVVGTVAPGARHRLPVTPCSLLTLTRPTLLLVGGEGGGLSPRLLARCQTLVTVPAGRQLVHGLDSLNVAVATGILLHALLASRTPPGPPHAAGPPPHG